VYTACLPVLMAAGTDGFLKHSKSKYYRPELDDKHPEVQREAVRKAQKENER